MTSKMSHSSEHKSPPERKMSSLEIGIDEAFLASDHSLLSMNIHKSVSEQRQLLFLRLLHAGLAGFSYFVALLLMLVAMSYNLGLLLAVIIGYAAGDFLFFERTVGLGLASSKSKHAVHIDHSSHLHGGSSGSGSGKGEESWLGQHKYSGECHV